ncbi:mCG1049163 [Mus musculus]|nr:mCG1049163 [Mus musculus]
MTSHTTPSGDGARSGLQVWNPHVPSRSSGSSGPDSLCCQGTGWSLGASTGPSTAIPDMKTRTFFSTCPWT